MKRTGILAFTFLFLLGIAPAQGDSPWLVGNAGHQTAMEIQKKTGEPVLLYFFTNWCPYCRQFERNILYTPQVEVGLQNATKVQIDVDQEPGLAEKYGVNSFPRVYGVPAKQNQIYQMSTGVSPEEFLEEAQTIGFKISEGKS